MSWPRGHCIEYLFEKRQHCEGKGFWICLGRPFTTQNMKLALLPRQTLITSTIFEGNFFPLVEILLYVLYCSPCQKKGVKLPCPILSRNNMLHPGACQWRSRVECPWQNRPGFFGLVGSGESTASWSGILAQDQKYGETPSNRPYYSRWRTTTV